jgi:hypothetical protein
VLGRRGGPVRCCGLKYERDVEMRDHCKDLLRIPT